MAPLESHKRIFAYFIRIIQNEDGEKEDDSNIFLPDPPGLNDSPQLNNDGEEYLNPYINFRVDHPRNSALLKTIAKVALQDIRKEEISNDFREELATAHLPTHPMFDEFAKKCFQSYKHRWDAKNDSRKHSMMEVNLRGNRLRGRRLLKFDERKKAAPDFFVNYSFDPVPLLHVDWMSDDESEAEFPIQSENEGKEDSYGSNYFLETKSEWRHQMLGRLGIKFSLATEELSILETVNLSWRAGYVDEIYHELSHLSRLRKNSSDNPIRKKVCNAHRYL
ncbi:hypothetical protein M422DRAFT_271053 [Sphaerobolus stellatus SS14]|uniref:Uncharacterized protein n=1 Tax=Sphaerobolus stellatus (strain SS14) TaxID=990650 RepID=A0A0C9TEM4_SPHS4|nr:hypothetical protein M422DRAFT_271053 [Sphaerobolus stellatus SS14]